MSTEFITIGIRAIDPMGPPTVTPRVDLTKEKLCNFGEELKGMVDKAFDKAMEAVRRSLKEFSMERQIIATQKLGAKKLGTEVEALKVDKVEGRINQSIEFQEPLIHSRRNEQTKFQSFQFSGNDKIDESVNHPSSGSASILTPFSGLDELGKGLRVSNPNLYYAHEYEPPSVSLSYLCTTISSAPQMFEENCNKQSASKVFDESPNSESVVTTPSPRIHTSDCISKLAGEIFGDKNGITPASINNSQNRTTKNAGVICNFVVTQKITISNGLDRKSSNVGEKMVINFDSGGGNGARPDMFVSSQVGNTDETFIDVYAKKNGVGDAVEEIEHEMGLNGEGNENIFLVFDPGGEGQIEVTSSPIIFTDEVFDVSCKEIFYVMTRVTKNIDSEE